MKKIVVFLLLLVSLNTAAQNDAVEDTAAKPVITAVGKPDGTKTEIKINKDGGSLKSSDGMVELIIPGGAVSKKTTISIQPISNLMANGNGKAYRFEPSGIPFQKSVQLIFHYDEVQITDSMQLLMGIAMQDDKGQWYSLNKFNLDTVVKTISGNINHFSDWSNFSAIKITPEYARVKVKKSIVLTVSATEPKESDDDDLAPLFKHPKKLIKETIWSVSGTKGGNPTVGELNIKDSWTIGNEYKAPASVPNQNPVAVSVKLEGLKFTFNKISFNNLRVASNLLIYDNAYEVTIISSIDAAAGSEFGTATYKDTGSFVVSLNGKDTKIIEKENRNAIAESDYKGKCEITLLEKGHGNVHIIGAQSINVIPPSSPQGNAWIDIAFKHAPTKLPILQFRCPPHYPDKEWTIDNNRKGNAMFAMMPAFPQRIKFEAKEGEQVITEMNESGIYLKITVKQLKEE